MADRRAVMAGMVAAEAEKRQESYRDLSRLLAESDSTLDWNEYMSATKTMKVLQNLRVDLNSQKGSEVNEAASICIHLLASPSFLTHIDTYGQQSLYDILLKILKANKTRKIMNLVLQSLAKSRLKKEVYLSDLKESFDVLREILQIKDLSPPVVCEALQVVMVLFSANPDASLVLGKLWFPDTFSKMFHVGGKVRKSALAVVNKVAEALDETSNPTHRSDIVATVLTDLKHKYCKNMVHMLLNGNTGVLQVWREIVVLLGIELHSRRSVTNQLLNVLEKAFKMTDPEVRVESFNSWHTIIDNFALDVKALTDHHKLQLLLTPFRTSNAKTEVVCNAKLHVWWHLVCLLAEKSDLVVNFDKAVVPLLRFCFIGEVPSVGNNCALSNRNLLMSGALSSPHRAFSSLHTARADVLAQLIATDIDVPKHKHSLPIIGKRVMSSVLFLQHYPLLLKCFGETIQTLSFSDEQHNTLGTVIFSHLLAHIRVVTATDVQKKEAVDVVRKLFSTLSHLESLCKPGDSQSQFLFKFYKLLTIGSLALHKKVLNSHQFHIPPSGGGDAQDIMCGTLSNHLITQLCRPALLHHSISSKEFISVWINVLGKSQPVTGKLRFLQAAVQDLTTSGLPFLCPDHPDVLCHLWSAVVRQVVTHISQVKSSEGEDSEADWDCIYSVLLFPVVHAAEAFTCAAFDVFENITEIWKKLWKMFTSLTMTTPTVEPNSEVEYVTHMLLTLCQEKKSDVPDVHTAFYAITVEVLLVLTEGFQYAKLGKGAEKAPVSPAKAKKQHPLHNLGLSVELLTHVFGRTCSMVSSRRMCMAAKLCQVALRMIKGIQQAPMKYIQEFITQLMDLLLKCVRVNPVVLFNGRVEKQCIAMLRCFAKLVVTFIRHKGAKPSVLEHLAALKPLFSTALNSTNEKVQQEVQKLLEGIIATVSAACLDVPPFLLEVQAEWGIAALEAPALDDSEDFIQATPQAKRTPKSLSAISSSSSSVSSPRKNTPLSPRKQETKQPDKNKVDKQAMAASPPTTRYSARIRKVKRRVKGDADAPSPAPATPEDSCSRVTQSTVHSAAGDVSSSTGAPSPQKKDRKPIKSQSVPSESEEKEQNKTEVEKNVGAASHPGDSMEPIVISSSELEKAPKDVDEDGHVNGAGSDVEAVSVAQKSQNLNPESEQHNSSVNIFEENDKDSDESDILWNPKRPSVSSPSKMQGKGGRRGLTKGQNLLKDKLKKKDEDLCVVLRDTSLQVQQLLSEKPAESAPITESKHDQASPFHKKSQTAANESLKMTSKDDAATKTKRITFMEVNVSPSIVKDAKLAQQEPKVKITSGNKVKEAPQAEVPDSNPEDDVAKFPSVTKTYSRKGSGVPKVSSSDKKQVKESVPKKPVSEEQTEGGASESPSSRGTRKRKLFPAEEDVVVVAVKRRKVESTAWRDSGSLDDCVIDLGSSTPEETKGPKLTPKSLRRTRSQPHPTDKEKEERSSTKPSFSPKVTRSGRKIFPPNKDMPEPLTPPKTSRKTLYQKANPPPAEEHSSLSSSSFVNLSSSSGSSESLLTEAKSAPTGEMEVDKSIDNKESEPERCERIDDDTKEDEDDSALVDISKSSDESVNRETSLEEAEKLNTSSSKTRKDSSVETSTSSGVAGEDACLFEDGGGSHAPLEEAARKEDVWESPEAAKLKSDEAAPKKEQQPKDASGEEKGTDVREDLTDPQKTSEESTPMECGQDLEGEVSYPAARRGTEVLEDSLSAEGENQNKDVGVQGRVSEEEAGQELSVEDDKVKGTEDKDAPVPQEEPNDDEDKEEEEMEEEEEEEMEEEEMEVEDKSSCGEDEKEEIEIRDSPTSPDPEVEEEEEEEEEFISAGQEKKEEDEQGEEEKTEVEGKDKMQEGVPCDKEQESGKISIDLQESKQRANTAMDKMSALELDVGEVTKLSLPEKITAADIKEGELLEMDIPSDEGRGDRGTRDATSAAAAVTSEGTVVVQSATGQQQQQQQQQHPVPAEAQNECQEANVVVPRDVQDNTQSGKALGTTKDSGGRDESVEESGVCDNAIRKEVKEAQSVASSRKQLSEHVNLLESVTCAEESSDSSRKEIQTNLTSESSIDEVAKTASSPAKNVDAAGAGRRSEDTLDTSVTSASPGKDGHVQETLPTSGNEAQANQPVTELKTETPSSPSKAETPSSPGKTETVSSPRKTVTPSSPGKTVTPSSPRKTVTPSSPGKTETVSSPRKTVTPSSPGKIMTPSSPGKTETASSPRKTVTPSSPGKIVTPSSPEKTEIVSSPRKTVTPSSPRKTVTPSSPKKTEAVSSPRKTVTPSSPEKTEAVSSPRKNVTISSPGKTVTVSGPKKTVTPSSPKKTVTPSSPKKTVTLSSPGKTEIPSSPGKTETISSPKKTVTPSSPSKTETPSSPNKTEMSSSPSKTETVSSLGKTVEDKVSLPSKAVHVQEAAQSAQKYDDKEAASSSGEVIVATETSTPTVKAAVSRLSETCSDVRNTEMEVQEEADPRVAQHADRTADSALEVTGAALEQSDASTRQQAEELSPDKSSRSKLKQTVSTPERMKQRGAIMHAGSRAAMLVACAKKNIKNRGSGESESPANVLTEGGRSRSLGTSPIRRGRLSPGHSPDSRRKSLLDSSSSVGMRPWVKHAPSPGASPSTSILKRTLISDGVDGDATSPPPAKYRRVSFADPPVSERVEIPPSPRILRGIRAQKRLDMTRMASEESGNHASPRVLRPERNTEVSEEDPICPGLVTCEDSVDHVAQHLIATGMLRPFLIRLENMGITTVGQLCKLTELEVSLLPVKPPKVTTTRRILKEYEKMWLRENSPGNSGTVDEVEVNLAKMFGVLDDKENLRPNQQDSGAAEEPVAETEVKESVASAGRSSHSDNIQEIMDMEEITPLYSSPEETEEDTLKNLYRRASEDDVEAQVKLLHHLLETLPSGDVAEAIAGCVKARMTSVTSTA